VANDVVDLARDDVDDMLSMNGFEICLMSEEEAGLRSVCVDGDL
jgi:hypothetical protein